MLWKSQVEAAHMKSMINGFLSQLQASIEKKEGRREMSDFLITWKKVKKLCKVEKYGGWKKVQFLWFKLHIF